MRLPVAIVAVGVVIADATAVGNVDPPAAVVAIWWAVVAFTVLAKNQNTRLFGWLWLAAPLALVALVVALPALAAAGASASASGRRR